MSLIKKLSLEELDEFIRIDTNAYPGVYNHSPDVQERIKKSITKTQLEDESADYYGIYRDTKLVGGMRIHHFTANVLSSKVPVGGIGSVAVDLLYKKEKVAKEILEYFVRHFRENQVSLVALYPFRPDFYSQMGFGYGTKMNQYKVKPEGFRKDLLSSKNQIQFLTKEHKDLVVECYQRYAVKTHGMMDKTAFGAEALFVNPNQLMVGYVQNGKVEGYLSFSIKKESETNFVFNDIHVKEFVYENKEALSQLLTFLHSQADQFNRIVFNTHDEHFHFLLNDPSNGSNQLIPSVYHESHTSGVGLMYRVVDVARFLEEHRFGMVDCTVKFNVKDSFFPENEQTLVVEFIDGKATEVNGPYEVEVTMDISDFSSVVMCATDISSLYRYGAVDISDETYLKRLDVLFKTHEKPICMTAF
ncbi:GNAT family N-acetyltransferase [Bacillus luteolus]|uniref:GNAT family N-acetyltransferase n=1 Tax=Litchfieldia luteola TaxID=682179 RepID=A0ABR9QN05_9BACI|nr:GNAT family N-acetyltransferase [Cytobacillus luteolus]MBE4909554.1 GNAT family N-acetyltransferase [Cytobacillus luteolus]MBP1940955.1 putative acetyltransferase [Cytobacillus luteolus]